MDIEISQKNKKGFRARVVLVLALIFLVCILNAAYVLGANLVGGKLSNALSFDGVGDYVTISNEGNFDDVSSGTKPVTVSWWEKNNINTGTSGISNTIFSKGDDSNPHWDAYWHIGSNYISMYVQFFASGGDRIQMYETTPFLRTYGYDDSDEWHHYAFSYDGSKTTAGFKLYKDGVADSSFAFDPNTLTSGVANNNNLVIGKGVTRNGPANSKNFDGTIDDFRIYNKALPLTEIAFLAGTKVAATQQVASAVSCPSGYINESVSKGADGDDGDVTKWRYLTCYTDNDVDGVGASTVTTTVTFITDPTADQQNEMQMSMGACTGVCTGCATVKSPLYDPDIYAQNALNLGNNLYYKHNVFLKWDTSSLPDDATITSASLITGNHHGQYNADASIKLIGEWYSAGNWPIDGETDFACTIGTNAIDTASFSAAVGADQTHSLSNPSAFISKTGDTGLRLGMSAGTPTGSNYMEFTTTRHAVGNILGPRLSVTYTSAASSQQVLSGQNCPSGYGGTNTDIDDNNIAVWQNLACYVNADGDGFGAESLGASQVASGASCPSGYIATGGDYFDNDPSKSCIANGQSCSGSGCCSGNCYTDVDGDYYAGSGSDKCQVSVSLGTDTNDDNNAIYRYLSCYVDADNDGYAAAGPAPFSPIQSNPSANGEEARAIAVDSSYMYIGGQDGVGGNRQLRFEKRDKTTGALVTAFSGDGIVQSSPGAGNNYYKEILVDSSYVYLAGYSSAPGNDQWHIEKRDKTTGALVTAFSGDGIYLSNPSGGVDDLQGAAIDSSAIYAVGEDSSPGGYDNQWRIEKIDITTGALVTAFDGDGIITSDLSTTSYADSSLGIKVDSSYIYIAGEDGVGGDRQWRIEKRDKNTGALVTAFGSNGVVQSDPAGDPDDEKAYDIAIDSSYIYVVGFDGGSGRDWRVEKRDITTGALVTAFDGDGVVQSDTGGGNNYAWNIVIDSSYIYVTGNAGSTGWRVEKRDITTGALVTAFSGDGIYESDPSGGNDISQNLAIDSSYIYIVGSDNVPGNDQWRIEKINIGDGGIGASAPVASSTASGASCPSGYSATSLGTDLDDGDQNVYRYLSCYADADNDGYAGGSGTNPGTANLVGHWKFDKGLGSCAAGHTDNGDGTCTKTFYPSLDGYVGRVPSGGETWSPIHNGAGDSGDNSGSQLIVSFGTTWTTNKWEKIRRGFFLFDTSSIPDGATIDSASFDYVLASSGNFDQFSGGSSVSITDAAPASNDDLVNADYSKVGSTKQANDVTIASLTKDGSAYNNNNLNAEGRGSIIKTGVSKFALRITSDVDNIEPTWAGGKTGQILPLPVETSGTSKDPKLVVTYTPGVGNDSTASNNDGTINGASLVDGKFSKALSFDGVDDHVSISDHSSLDITQAITIVAWIKPTSFGQSVGQGRVADKNVFNFNVHGSGGGNDNTFRFNIAAGSLYAESNSINLNEWQHVIGTYDRQKIKIYINGVLKGETAETGAISTNNNPLLIGSSSEGPRYFNGKIDDVRIYNRALTADEAKFLAAQGLPGTENLVGHWTFDSAPALVLPGGALVAPGNLVGHWKMDEGSGTTTSDSSANSNNGAISGASWVDGKSGKALSFSGGQRVNVPHNNNFDLTTGLTMSAWVKPSAAEDGVILGRGPWDGQGFRFKAGAGWMNTQFWINGGQKENNGAAAAVTAGVWTHVAVTYDGTNIKHYANGIETFSLNWPGTLTYGSGDVSIGAASDSRRSFKGDIDDARIYNKALTADEIGLLMGTKVADSSGKGNIGTIGGTQAECNTAGGYFSPGGDNVCWINTASAGTSCVGVCAGKGLRDALVTDWATVISGNNAYRNGLLGWACPANTITTDSGDCQAGYVPGCFSGYSQIGAGNSCESNWAVDKGGWATMRRICPCGGGSGPTSVDGKLGKALSFDGVNDYVNAGNDASLLVTQGTLAFWVKATSSNSDWYVAIPYREAAGWSNPYLSFTLGNEGASTQYILTIDGVRHQGSCNTVSNDNVWYHLAVTYDGTTIRCYRNGVEGASKNAPGSITYSGAPSFIMGQRSVASPDDYMTGSLDDVRIYNKALTANEIQLLSELGVGTTIAGGASCPAGYKTTSSGADINDDPSTGASVWQTLACYVDADGDGYGAKDDSNTKLLLHFDGDYVDATGVHGEGSAMGSPSIDTSIKKFGSGALKIHFDGTAQSIGAISFPNHADWAFGSNPFTVDFWFYMTNLANGHQAMMIGNNDWDPKTGWTAKLENNVKEIGFYGNRYDLNTDQNTGVHDWELNKWYHVAFVREGTGAGQFKQYLNGVQVQAGQSYTVGNINTGDDKLYIGKGFETWGSNNPWPGWQWDGYIDEVRISDVARWTNDFVPPSEAYPVAESIASGASCPSGYSATSLGADCDDGDGNKAVATSCLPACVDWGSCDTAWLRMFYSQTGCAGAPSANLNAALADCSVNINVNAAGQKRWALDVTDLSRGIMWETAGACDTSAGSLDSYMESDGGGCTGDVAFGTMCQLAIVNRGYCVPP